MKHIFTTLIALILVSFAHSQVSIKADMSQNFSVDYKFNNKYRIELEVFEQEIDLSNLKPMFKVELLKKDDFDGYMGLGLAGLDPVDVITIPIGIDFYPFEKKSFSVVIELENQIGNDYHPIGNLGFRYRFDHKKLNN